MDKGSTAYVYGALSLKGSVIDATDLIFRKQTVKGFWLTDWIKERNVLSLLYYTNKLKGLLQTQLKTEVSQESTLEDFQKAIEFYTNNMSKGKVIFKPQLKTIPEVPAVAPIEETNTNNATIPTDKKQPTETNVPAEKAPESK